MVLRFYKGGPVAHKSDSLPCWGTFRSTPSLRWMEFGCMVAIRVLSEWDYEVIEDAREACECPAEWYPHHHVTSLLPLET